MTMIILLENYQQPSVSPTDLKTKIKERDLLTIET